MGKIISIGNQKGGCGKSTLTSFIANYLHEEFGKKGLRILVVDADDLQTTLYNVRQKEIGMEAEGSEEDGFYHLVKMPSEELAHNIDVLRSEYDLIFVDLPGNLKQEGVVSVYAYVDALFIPTESSFVSVKSTADFIEFYRNVIVKRREELGLKTVFTMFFNRVVERNKDFKELYNSRDKFGVPIMENYITESIPVFQRGISTIYKYSSESKGEFIPFINEFMEVLNQLK